MNIHVRSKAEVRYFMKRISSSVALGASRAGVYPSFKTLPTCGRERARELIAGWGLALFESANVCWTSDFSLCIERVRAHGKPEYHQKENVVAPFSRWMVWWRHGGRSWQSTFNTVAVYYALALLMKEPTSHWNNETCLPLCFQSRNNGRPKHARLESPGSLFRVSLQFSPCWSDRRSDGRSDACFLLRVAKVSSHCAVFNTAFFTL